MIETIGVTSVVIIVASMAVRTLIQEYTKSQVQHNFNIMLEAHKGQHSIQLETHKAEVQKIVEEIKLDAARRSQDFSLYTVKRHESYAKLNELIIASYSTVSHLLIGFGHSFDHFTDQEVENWLNECKFGQKDKIRIMDLLPVSQSQAIYELRLLERRYDIFRANDNFNQMKKYWLESRLYVSDEVTKLIKSYIDNCAILLVYLENKSGSEDRGDLIIAHDHELDRLVDELTEAMKQELQKGFYTSEK